MRLGGGRAVEGLHHIFEVELAAAVAGGSLRAHVGFGPDTDKSLIAIALAQPHVTHTLVAAARQAFAEEVAASAAGADPVDEPNATENELPAPGGSA
ncbi:hypothetical protein ACLMAL_11460 [Nocardia sp. CWNU-33]|uniref:hypothetical protein n=1 Tax=Nocardia sp. CWNU-33 TaxID=3392117 RepID=UPI00398E453B